MKPHEKVFSSLHQPITGARWTRQSNEPGTILSITCDGRIVRWLGDGAESAQTFQLAEFLQSFKHCSAENAG